MMKKRIIGLLLCFALCLTLFSPVAFAAEAVCRNQTTGAEYETLAEAVNSASAGDTIIVLKDCTVDSAIRFKQNINIEGASGSEVISRDTAVNTGRIFFAANHTSQITVTFKNIILDGGAAWDLQASDAASAKNRVDANKPATEALMVLSGNVAVCLNEGTVIRNCDTYRASSMSYTPSAGAIYCDAQSNSSDEKIEVSLDHAVIKNCSAGGNVYSEAGAISCINYNNNNKITFKMNGSTVTGCAALNNNDNTAGGLFLASCDTTITNSRIIGNYTYNFGGGLTQRWGVSTITDSEIAENDAGESGGGITLYTTADCTLKGSTVVRDNTSYQGAGFDITSNKNAPLSSSSKLTLADNVKIIRNKATGVGGGILFFNCSYALIGEAVEITLNEAANGGGIYTTSYEKLESLDLKGSVYQNKASAAGADIYAQSTVVNKISLPIASAMDKVYLSSANVPYRITDWYFDYPGDRFDPVNNITGTYTDGELKKDLALVAAGAERYIFTVSFNANGHGTAPASQTVEINNTAEKPADPTASGYTFGGWYTEAECTNAFDFATPITKNITLYAKWTQDGPYPPDPTYYTVSFDMNGHGKQIAAQTVEEENKAAKPADPTAANYIFKGWYTDPALQTAFDFDTVIRSDMTLYAKWVHMPKTGDNNNVLLWSMLFAASGAVLAGTAVCGRKRKHD